MQFLVTGGLGVNGAWVLRTLLDRGHEVAVFENRPDTSLIEDIADRVEVLVGDLSHVDEVSSAVSKAQPSCVIHLAAFVDCERSPRAASTATAAGRSRGAATTQGSACGASMRFTR